MKTVLHLFTKDSENSVFFHPINELLNPNIGDDFNYVNYHRQLNKYELDDFNKKELKNEIYIVTDLYDDEKQNLRFIYLKPKS